MLVSRWFAIPTAAISPGCEAGITECFYGYSYLCTPYFSRVVFNPARLGKNLLYLLLSETENSGVVIEDNRANAGRARIKSKDVRHMSGVYRDCQIEGRVSAGRAQSA